MISPCVGISSCVDGLGYVLRSPLIIKRNLEYKLLPVVQSTALAQIGAGIEEKGMNVEKCFMKYGYQEVSKFRHVNGEMLIPWFNDAT